MKFNACKTCDFRIEHIFSLGHQPHCSTCKITYVKGEAKINNWKRWRKEIEHKEDKEKEGKDTGNAESYDIC
jgi:hypothetical protein